MESKATAIMLLTFYFSSLPNVAGNTPTAHLHPDVCVEENFCHPHGPSVRFPFGLLGKQPENCSYNSYYNLHCDELNRTILELPSSSSKYVVTYISYRLQRMEIEPFESCFAKQLRDLNFSSTQFEYYLKDLNFSASLFEYDPPNPYSFSLFNCSTEFNRGSAYAGLECLNSGGYSVTVIPTYANLRELVTAIPPYENLRLESCNKMYDTSLIPRRILEGENSVELSWSLPECKGCEMRGGLCKWENRIANTIGCTLELGSKGQSGFLKVLRIPGPIIGCFLLAPAISAILFLYSKMEQKKENQLRIRKFVEDYAAMKPTRYSYADIKKITKNFRYKLGEGSYGNVFRGKIANKIDVAVKLLHNSTGNGEEFVNEVGTIGTIHHVNVVRLLGFCADGCERALIFEFLPNGSLDKFIFPDGEACPTLGIAMSQNIAIGIARGIEYLHQGCQQRILHFDIKPHNILLDENYHPKISDFGLAKLCEKGKSAVSMTAARGTMGYIAPEVFSRQFGSVTYKYDIYSFGMLLLEMVGRRKNIDTTVQNNSQVYFPEWLYERLIDGEELRIQIEEDGEHEIAKKLAIVGLWCIQWNPVDRPSISYVLQMLEGNCDNLDLPSNPFTSKNAVKPVDLGERKREITPVLEVISE